MFSLAFFAALVIGIIFFVWGKGLAGRPDTNNPWVLETTINMWVYIGAVLLMITLMSCFPPKGGDWHRSWLAEAFSWRWLFLIGFGIRLLSLIPVPTKDQEGFKFLSYLAPAAAMFMGLLTAYVIDPSDPSYKWVRGFSQYKGEILANAWLRWMSTLNISPAFTVGLLVAVIVVVAVVYIYGTQSFDYSNLSLVLGWAPMFLGLYTGLWVVGLSILAAVSSVFCVLSSWGEGTITWQDSWFAETLSWAMPFFFMGLLATMAVLVKASSNASNWVLRLAIWIALLSFLIAVLFGFLGGFPWIEYVSLDWPAYFRGFENPGEFYADSWAWWLVSFKHHPPM